MTVGRQPVKNFKIETIYDLSEPRILEFRKTIYHEDLQLDMALIHEDRPHKWWMANLPPDVAEDAYKYCDRKWNTVMFDNIECIIEDGKIVGMSGCRTYGGYLRVSMHLYLLKKFRAKYPGIKYLDGGYFDRHLEYARSQNNIGIFFTVYPYSKKLKALISNHTSRTISLVDKKYLKHMDKIEIKGTFLFNDVPQTFFYYPITTGEFYPDDIV